MLYLTLIVGCMSGFWLGARGAQKADADTLAVGAVNYTFAAVICWGALGILRPDVSHQSVMIGAFTGACYVGGYFCLLQAMSHRGTAIAAAVGQMSVLIPIIGALIIWREQPSQFASVGIALAVVSLPMLSLDKGVTREGITPGLIAILFGLFLCNGLGTLFPKWFHSLELGAQRPVFVAALFTTAAIIGAIAWLRNPNRRISTSELVWGSIMGACNVTCALTILYALDAFLASVLYPLIAALSLAVITAIAAIAWREIPSKLGWTGLSIALVAVVLTNM